MRRLALPDFSPKLFAAGLAGGVLVHAALVVTLSLNADSTMARMQDLLASKMVVIEKPGFPKKVAQPKEVHPVPVKEPGATHMEDAPHEASARTAFPGLTEQSAQGTLPIIRQSDGMTPFKAYSKAYTKSSSLPRIALVIKDYGMKSSYSDRVLSLPANATLLASPYSAQAENWQKKAQEKGFELWLQVPFETGDFISTDPGPRAISSTLLLAENEARLNGSLAQITGYAGVAGFYNNHFKDSAPMIQNLAEQVFKRGLGYLELNPSAHPATIAETATGLHAPYASTTIDLGDPRFGGKVTDALEIAEGLALDKKPVVLLAPPYPALMDELTAWEAGLAAKGITMAPLSAMVSNAQ